jgi:TfoX/Sxy family transcriptional regulator of competence genes
MKKISWKKSPPQLVETFHGALPDDPLVERRKMFGYPCAFVHGNMFAGLHQESMVLRLSEAERAAMPGARPFEPLPGRVMREYVVVPTGILSSGPELRAWAGRALAYAASLPRKQKTAAKRASKPKAGKARKPAGETKKRGRK